MRSFTVARSTQAFQSNTPSVSVIIPTYNYAQILAEAIESVLNQTFTDIELLVIDDGSTDCTAQIAQDTGVRVIQNETKTGAASARNVGAAEIAESCPLVVPLHPRTRQALGKLGGKSVPKAAPEGHVSVP